MGLFAVTSYVPFPVSVQKVPKNGWCSSRQQLQAANQTLHRAQRNLFSASLIFSDVLCVRNEWERCHHRRHIFIGQWSSEVCNWRHIGDEEAETGRVEELSTSGMSFPRKLLTAPSCNIRFQISSPPSHSHPRLQRVSFPDPLRHLTHILITAFKHIRNTQMLQIT